MVRHGGSGAQPCASVLPFPLRLCIHVSPLPSRPRHRLCATAAIAAKTLPLPCITAHACRQQQFDCAARRPPGRRDRLGPRKCEPNRRQSSPPLWTTHHTHGSNHLGFSAKWRWPPGNNLLPTVLAAVQTPRCRGCLQGFFLWLRLPSPLTADGLLAHAQAAHGAAATAGPVHHY